MKRSGPIKRTSGLKRGRALPRRSERAWEARREGDDAREAVLRRSGGRCEVDGPDCTLRASGTHHRLREAHGGPTTPENLVAVCRSCHTDAPGAIHRQPAWAYENGLLIHSWDGPPTEVWSPAQGC